MDREIQKILFKNSVDIDALTRCANDLVDKSIEAGDPKRLRIEVRKASEFDDKLSMEDIFDEIDLEYSKDVLKASLLRVSKVNDYYVILGVKL